MPAKSADSLTIENLGKRRVILGPPPKSSKTGGKVVTLDTPADDVVTTSRWGRLHELEGPDGKRWKDNRVLKALASKLHLQVA